MCPVCLATALLLASGATSTGGLAAIAIKKFGVKHAVESHSALPQSDDQKRNP